MTPRAFTGLATLVAATGLGLVLPARAAAAIAAVLLLGAAGVSLSLRARRTRSQVNWVRHHVQVHPWAAAAATGAPVPLDLETGDHRLTFLTHRDPGSTTIQEDLS